jgi:hypothetical protein
MWQERASRREPFVQAVDDDDSEKTTQQSNKETRGDDEEHSKGEGKRESDTSIFLLLL